MRLAAPLAIVALAATLAVGCGDSSSRDSNAGGTASSPPASTSTAPAGASAHACPLDAGGAERLRATGVSCGEAQRLALAWNRSEACASPAGASRSGCTVRSYRCLAAATDRGLSVGCSRRGRSVAFIVRR